MSRLRGNTAGKALAVLAFVVVFLTIGLPRFIAGDSEPAGSNADANFTKICREHGGTPSVTPAAGPARPAERRCTVRYGRTTYLMDAITPNGFDEDTAHFQRQGCDAAKSEQATAPKRRRESFIYHPDTGVCERRP